MKNYQIRLLVIVFVLLLLSACARKPTRTWSVQRGGDENYSWVSCINKESAIFIDNYPGNQQVIHIFTHSKEYKLLQRTLINKQGEFRSYMPHSSGKNGVKAPNGFKGDIFIDEYGTTLKYLPDDVKAILSTHYNFSQF